MTDTPVTTVTNGKSPSALQLSAISTSMLTLAALYFPVLFPYLRGLWGKEHYQFFPFAFATTCWFSVSVAATQPNFSAGWLTQTLRVTACLAAIVFTASGAALRSPFVCYVGFALHFCLLLELYQDRETKRRLLFTSLPMLLTVSLPLDYDNRAIAGLQLITSRLSSEFLNTMNFDHFRRGNVIQPMHGNALEIADACSGVQSLFTVLFIVAFIGVSKQYSVLRTLVLMSTGVFWALAMNVLRVLTIAIAQMGYSVDLTTGWKHDAVGYVALVLSIPFLLSSDMLLKFLIGGIPDDPKMYPRINVLVRLWNWGFTAPSTQTDTIAVSPTVQNWRSLHWSHKYAVIALLALLVCSVLPCWVQPGFLR
jgi:exosortase